MEMLGKHHLVSGHVNAPLRSRSQLLQNPTSPWREVLRLPSEMKAALLPRSNVEKVGQCTWGKDLLLLLCSHPSNSDLIISMNTFKLVAVFSPLLQMSPTNLPWPLPQFWFSKTSPLSGVEFFYLLDYSASTPESPPPKCIGLLSLG